MPNEINSSLPSNLSSLRSKKNVATPNGILALGAVLDKVLCGKGTCQDGIEACMAKLYFEQPDDVAGVLVYRKKQDIPIWIPNPALNSNVPTPRSRTSGPTTAYDNHVFKAWNRRRRRRQRQRCRPMFQTDDDGDDDTTLDRDDDNNDDNSSIATYLTSNANALPNDAWQNTRTGFTAKPMIVTQQVWDAITKSKSKGNTNTNNTNDISNKTELEQENNIVEQLGQLGQFGMEVDLVQSLRIQKKAHPQEHKEEEEEQSDEIGHEIRLSDFRQAIVPVPVRAQPQPQEQEEEEQAEEIGR